MLENEKDDATLGSFLREVSNWRWDDFIDAEHDANYSTNQAIIFALIRSCAMEQLAAIKIALNRLDGKLKTPVKIEYPKIYFLYPNATNLPAGDVKQPAENLNIQKVDVKFETKSTDLEIIEAPEIPEPEVMDLATLSLRQTVAKMADYPRMLPANVIKLATAVDQWKSNGGPHPDEIPAVKSVVAAHLLQLAQTRNIAAVNEVFDQIDGKLVETIQILGEDIFITSYSLTAPQGAYLNEDGVMQLEAAKAQDLWAEKLSKQNG